jgi:hypothetical protein
MHSTNPSPPARLPRRSSTALLSTALLLSAQAAGCGPQVIYAPTTGPVRLAENVSARIYVRNPAGQWIRSANPVTLQAGEYVLQLPASTQP